MKEIDVNNYKNQWATKKDGERIFFFFIEKKQDSGSYAYYATVFHPSSDYFHNAYLSPSRLTRQYKRVDSWEKDYPYKTLIKRIFSGYVDRNRQISFKIWLKNFIKDYRKYLQ